MGKSYKKTPIVKDNQGKGVMKRIKRQANKKIRRYKDTLADGKAYRKVTNPYDIHDYISRWTYEDEVEWHKFSISLYENGHYGKRSDKWVAELYELSYFKWAKTFRNK